MARCSSLNDWQFTVGISDAANTYGMCGSPLRFNADFLTVKCLAPVDHHGVFVAQGNEGASPRDS
ncbi:MAG: hypothetical protein M2R45_02802 [Verrucomicrobia subdivision 3 bacterium]|nr:hypothetical protein [Limisphaerales bacterium]MCS1414354.1 hypothetical protein [Limisphaerales bacterium]